MLRPNFLKAKLESGQVVLGTWSVIPSVFLVDVLASSGLDFIIIDSEHGPVNYVLAAQMIITCESRGVSPIIRVPGVSESDILKALDIGAHAIQVPNIRDWHDLEKVVLYSKYPPLGQRGLSPFTRAGNYTHENKDYTERANENVLVVVHVESIEAIQNLDVLLSNTTVDIIFLGLYDISKSLGIPGQVDHPSVMSPVQEAIFKIREARKFSGTICTTFDQMRNLIKMGVKYVTFSVDCEVIQKGYKNIREKMEEVLSKTL